MTLSQKQKYFSQQLKALVLTEAEMNHTLKDVIHISVEETKIKRPIFCDANGDMNKRTTKYLTGRRRNHKKEKSAD